MCKDGIVNPERNDTTRYDARRIDILVYYINTLAMAYHLTGEESFAIKGVDVLYSWFIDSATKMNPNLNFSHMVPGKNQGTYSGIIETVAFIGVTDSIRMLEPSPHYSKVQQTSVKDWFREYLYWLQISQFGIKEGLTKNNHAVWYDAQVAVYAHFIDRDDIAKSLLAEVPQKRIAVQIEADGKMPRELTRTKARHYTAYTLQAFITLARVGNELGINLYDYGTADGRSIRKAIDWFLPYALTEQAMPYQEITAFTPINFARYLHLANLYYKDYSYDLVIQNALHKAQLNELVLKSKLIHFDNFNNYNIVWNDSRR